MRTTLAIFSACTLCAALVGCQAPPKPTGPTEMLVNVDDYETFVDRALTVLREHDLQPSFVDRDGGVIRTNPTTGAQWFEFARSDSQGAYQILESSIHTIGRTAKIVITPVDEAAEDETHAAGTYRVSAEVQKHRYSIPQRQVTTASGALSIFSQRMPTREGIIGKEARGLAHWVPLGRDGLLEERLLERILKANPQTAVVAAAP